MAFSAPALSNFVVARPMRTKETEPESPLVSVIVPARNEAGNMAEIITRIPEMGKGTEIVFVEGHSKTTRTKRSKGRLPLILIGGRSFLGKPAREKVTQYD